MSVTELFAGIIGALVAGLIFWGLGRLVVPGRQRLTVAAGAGVVAVVCGQLGGFVAAMLNFGTVLTFIAPAALASVGVWLLLRWRGYPSRY